MKLKRYLIGIALVVIFATLWRLWHRQSESSSADSSAAAMASGSQSRPNKPETSFKAQLQESTDDDDPNADWRTPIVFYGKVVDENNRPVSGADVKIIVSDTSEDGTTHYNLLSAEDGTFVLRDITGRGLSVYVSKDGYYTLKDVRRNFEYAGEGRGNNYHPIASRHEIFRLKKRGETAALTQFERDVAIPKDGTPTYISLYSGKAVPEHIGHLEVRIWNLADNAARGKKYDWRCEISLPGGGLLETKEEFAFEAPHTGYDGDSVFDMSKDMERGWTRDVSRSYYVRLRDGNFGLLHFRVIAGKTNFVSLKAFVNPDGERNLEFDRYKAVKIYESLYGVTFTYPDGRKRTVPW